MSREWTRTGKVVVWLKDAYDTGMTSELLGSLINEIQHQGDPSEAMYARCAPLGLAVRTRRQRTIPGNGNSCGVDPCLLSTSLDEPFPEG